MFARRHWVKLLLFGVIALLSVGYAGGSYAGLDRLFGTRGYVVTVNLTDSGGIFVNSEVTYRGHQVGEVDTMRLTDKGVAVDLDIEATEPIPRDTRAVVANGSAVGEQYVDLRPNREGGPYLRDGSVIASDRTALPPAPDSILSNLDKFVSSVDPRSLRTVVDEAYDAFRGTGPDLQRLLDSAASFTSAARANLPQTSKLLADGRTVLRTQQRQADNITALASGLRTIAGRLKQSDPDLRRVIDRAPKLATEIDDILARSGNSLGVLIANLLTTAQITSVRTDALEQTLVAFPVVSAFGPTVTSNGEGHLGMTLNFFDPHSCTRGYEGTKQRHANDTGDTPPNTQAYCAEPRGSPSSVRGAQNAPYAGKPGAPATSRTTSEATSRPRARPASGDALPGVLGLSAEGGSGGLDRLLGLPR